MKKVYFHGIVRIASLVDRLWGGLPDEEDIDTILDVVDGNIEVVAYDEEERKMALVLAKNTLAQWENNGYIS